MALEDTAHARIIAGAAATIGWQGVDQYGEPGDPGTVTVGVVRSNGDAVVSAGTATAGTTTSPRTFALTVAQTAQVDRLTATFTSGTTDVAEIVVDVVGGAYVSQTAAGEIEPTLATLDLSPAAFRRCRAEVEAMFEDACSRAFVPRLSVETIEGGTCHLVLRYPHLRRVVWATVDGEAVTGFDEVPANEYGIAYLEDGWPCGRITLGYEHGYRTPPADVVHAAVRAIRYQSNAFASGITDRAMSFQPVEGGNIVLATPGLGSWVTGVPAVDEVLKRNRWTRPVVA